MVTLHLNHVATLCCDVLLVIIHVSGCCCLSDINISQGSIATHLRFDGIFHYHFARNLLLSLSVKEFWKLVSICQSQRQKYSGTFFLNTVLHENERLFYNSVKNEPVSIDIVAQNMEEISDLKILHFSTSPVKCSHCTLRHLKKVKCCMHLSTTKVLSKRLARQCMSECMVWWESLIELHLALDLLQ